MTESTAVAQTKAAERKDAIGRLPPEIRAALELRKAQKVVSAELGRLNWGSKIDGDTRLQVVEWCRQYDVDPATELDILGNKFYKNAAWHLRKLGEMVDAGLVEYAVTDHVAADPRLLELSTKGDQSIKPRAVAELHRRQFERIARGIPENAAAAVLFRIKLRSMIEEVVGCSWAGGGSRKNDPVGEAEPVKTAESRAARRAVRLIAGSNKELATLLARGDTEAEIIAQRVHDVSRETMKHPATKAQVPLPATDRDGNVVARLPAGEVRTEVIDQSKVHTVSKDHPFLTGPDPFEQSDEEKTEQAERQRRIQADLDLAEDQRIAERDAAIERGDADEDDAA